MWCVLRTPTHPHSALAADSCPFSPFSRLINGLGWIKDVPKVMLRSAFPNAVWQVIGRKSYPRFTQNKVEFTQGKSNNEIPSEGTAFS